MSALREAIRRVVADLTALDRRFAVIGGLAVSVRAEPRFTRDVDVAVAVASDESIEVFPDVMVPVARGGHLLALKVLARDDDRRPQDLVDIRALIAMASPEDLALARLAVKLIERRGFARGRELPRLLAEVLDNHAAKAGPPGGKGEAPSPAKPGPKRTRKRRRSS